MPLKVLFLTAAIFIMAAPLFSQVKRPEPPPQKPTYDRSRQVIIVTTPDWNTVQGKAQLFQRVERGKDWNASSESFSVVVGRSGLGWDQMQVEGEFAKTVDRTFIKHEGDGRAPAGFFPLTFAFGNSDVGSKLPFTKLDEFTECVDDVNSNFYNKIANRMQVGNFDWKSSEKMLAVGQQYDLGIFVAYNSYPAIRGNGSCIFLHIWKDNHTGTAGCTAMSRNDLEKIIKWLDPAKTPYLIQMPEAEYNSFRQRLKLPKLK